VIWLQSPPWGRWLLAFLIAAVAVWVEVRPETTVEHPFAIAAIPPGTALSEAAVEWRRVPAGLFEPVEADALTAREVPAGEPVLPSSVTGDAGGAPPGWWVIETDVPAGALPGERARVVVLDTGVTAEAYIVATGSADPFGSGEGSVAVDPAYATEAAMAAAQGRLVVMIETG
jgi:hypothetical protein